MDTDVVIVLRSGAPLFLSSLTFPRVGLLTYSLSPSRDLILFWLTYLTVETRPNLSQSILSHLVTISMCLPFLTHS